MKKKTFFAAVVLLQAVFNYAWCQDLKLNDLEYFETQGVNVLVYNNLFTGGFNDEKNAGIELIHHGVRTAQGGAVRLSNAPEQWDLVPEIPIRKVDRTSKSIESTLRFEDFDFESRVVVTAKGKGVEISVYLDKPVPKTLEGSAGFNLEFLPSQYWAKTYLMDGRINRFPRYVVGNTITRPNSEKLKQFKGYETYDDRGTGKFIDLLPLETGRTLLLAPNAFLYKIGDDGKAINVFSGNIEPWGDYFKYHYVKFDFTSVNTPGGLFATIYSIVWGQTLSTI